MMPHRAGYFVLAYSWDHHCRRLYDNLNDSLGLVERVFADLEEEVTNTASALAGYCERWQNAERLRKDTAAEIEKRRFVINSLGYRGYGVNRDLLAALDSLAERCRPLEVRLHEQLRRKAASRSLPPLVIHIVDGRKAGLADGKQPGTANGNNGNGKHPAVECPPHDLDRYWHVMAGETAMETNTSIFQRMFLSAGCASMSVMKGSTGLHNGYSCQDLKLRANMNFVHTVRGLFAGLSDYAEVNMDLLRNLHCSLMAGLDPRPGAFREIDFPDRNGVTFEFGNFQREASDLAIVLDETARSFHHLDEFVYNLARAYYMFLGIHPFWDCNGRVGRCFLNLLFLKKGLPPVTLDCNDEVLALPRYGGSMEDMHELLKRRLRQAADTYLYERWKLEAFGLLGTRVFNPSFDSGFHFRQIDCVPRKIEVHFEVLITADTEGLGRSLADESQIVLPEAGLISDLCVYCGFCRGPFTEWRHSLKFEGDFYHREIHSDNLAVRTFDIDFIIEVPPAVGPGEWFACSVVCEERGLIFNNKGLNYSYRLER